ncbi:conserved exported protein of unknown function [Ruminococcaceae bacterium BL-6]|nr:conserved exported protein of unknown function [Ruminococcaceae bacterium BL-6]
MKSTTKNLIAVAAVLVVLGGALAALKLTDGKDGGSSSSVSDESISLISRQVEDVASMKVSNGKGGFTIVPKLTEEAASSGAGTASSGTEKVSYVVQGLEDLPLYTSMAESVLGNGFSLVATKNVGAVEDLDEYGLKAPKASVQVNFRDGTTFAYSIGNESPGSSGSYYMCGKDSKNVYVVSVDEGIFSDAKDFVQKEIFSLNDSGSAQDTTTAPEFAKIALSGKNFASPLTIAKDSSDGQMYLSAGGQKYRTDDTAYSALVSALTTVTADEVAAVHVGADQLKSFGLDQPAAQVEFTVDKKTHRIRAGGTKDGSRYVMADDVDAVFLLKEDSVKAWASVNLYGLRSKYVYLPNVADVSGIDVTAGGKTYRFEKPRVKSEKQSTEDKTAYDYTVTCNGAKVTYDPNFVKYYQNLIQVQTLEDSAEKPKGEALLTLTYRFYDSKRAPVTASFYSAGNRRCLAVVNGAAVGLVTEKNVQQMIADTETASKNGTVQTAF